MSAKCSGVISKAKSGYLKFCRSTAVKAESLPRLNAQQVLFLSGVMLLGLGLTFDSKALVTNYNDDGIARATNYILTYLEGSFGALVMVAAGIGAIMSSAFGQYKAALSLLVVAVGSFILRSVLATFFNDSRIQQ